VRAIYGGPDGRPTLPAGFTLLAPVPNTRTAQAVRAGLALLASRTQRAIAELVDERFTHATTAGPGCCDQADTGEDVATRLGIADPIQTAPRVVAHRVVCPRCTERERRSAALLLLFLVLLRFARGQPQETSRAGQQAAHEDPPPPQGPSQVIEPVVVHRVLHSRLA
jgi:hypothetical protein